MVQIIEFVTNHWILVSAFLMISAMLVINILQADGAGALAPQQAVQLLNRQNAVTVDIRTAAEFKDGHVINALHIPLPELKQRLKELEKFKGKPILICCAAGTASNQAVKALHRAGFEQVSRLKGGVAAWRTENLPLTTGK